MAAITGMFIASEKKLTRSIAKVQNVSSVAKYSLHYDLVDATLRDVI